MASLLCKFKPRGALNDAGWLALALHHDRAVVLTAAVTTAMVWYFIQPIVFTYDSFSYLNAARAIVGEQTGSFVYFRAPLTPLLLAITGVPVLGTFNFFVLAQTVLGIAIVMIVHDTLRAIDRRMGFVLALLSVTTFMAFVQSKSIMTEQVYLLGWVLCIHGGIGFLSGKNGWALAEITVALLILVLTRAQGAMIAFTIFPILLLSRPRKFRMIAGCVVIFGAAVLCYGLIHTQMARSIQQPAKAAGVSAFGVTNSTGKMLFMVVYWDTYRYLKVAAVDPRNGPASSRLFDEMRAYYAGPGNLEKSLGATARESYVGQPEAVVKQMMTQPTGQYWFSIWQAMDDRMGAAAADQLLLRVTLEGVWAHPLLVAATYARNFAVALVVADSAYVWKHPTFDANWVGKPLADNMVASGNSDAVTPLAAVLNVYFPLLQIAALVMVLASAPLAWKSGWLSSWLFCAVLIIYNQATVALAATPEARYTFYILPPYLIMLAIAWIGMMPSSAVDRG